MYVLENSSDNSRTWCIHLRNISKIYGMDNPLTLLNSSPPTKNQYKENVKIIVAAYHEKQLRIKLKNSQSAKYFNTSLLGLSGKLMPSHSRFCLYIKTIEYNEASPKICCW